MTRPQINTSAAAPIPSPLIPGSGSEQFEKSIEQHFQIFRDQLFSSQNKTLRQRWLAYWHRKTYRDEAEYLDRDDIPVDVRIRSVQALSRLYDRLGYHRILIFHLQRVIKQVRAEKGNEVLRILDIGAGGGGLLRAIYRWAEKEGVKLELCGLDLSADFARATEESLRAEGIHIPFLQGDACDLKNIKDGSFDIVLTSSMVHHLRSAGKVALFFSEVYRVAARGWVLADLDRRFYGPGFVHWACTVFGTQDLIIADGEKSARRAYSIQEINFILQELKERGSAHNFLCRAYPGFPYWMVEGVKQEYLNRGE